jgi:hypothetical protein
MIIKQRKCLLEYVGVECNHYTIALAIMNENDLMQFEST